jgi:hypothetical protein
MGGFSAGERGFEREISVKCVIKSVYLLKKKKKTFGMLQGGKII